MKPRIALVTNTCPHYRRKLFELLGQQLDIDFYFFDFDGYAGWGSPTQDGQTTTIAKGSYFVMHSLRLPGKLRFSPELVWKLWRGNYDVIIKCTNGRMELPLVYGLCRLMRKKFILWHTYWGDLDIWWFRWTKPLLNLITRRSEAILVYGEHGKRYLLEQGVSEEKIFIACQATDNDLYARPVTEDDKRKLEANLGLQGTQILLNVGRLEPEKGLDYLVQATALLRKGGLASIALLFIGRGPEEVALKRLCQSLDVPAVFLPPVPPEELYRYYALATIFILPSVRTKRFLEPWGFVVNEAMNQERAVVATTEVGAVAGGLLRHKETGVAVPPRNPKALSQALASLLEDEPYRERLGKQAKSRVAAFNYDRAAAAFKQAIAYACKTRATTT